DSKRQYLLYPYDAFAIDITTEFRAVPGCEDDLTEGSEECWTPPTLRRRRFPREFSCEELNDSATGLTDEQKEDCLDCGDGDCPAAAVNGAESEALVILELQGGSQVGTLKPATGVHTVPECDVCDTMCEQIEAATASEIVDCIPGANGRGVFGVLTAEPEITP